MSSPGPTVDVTAFAEDYPFSSNYFELPGGRAHYVDEGSRNAEPLLMLHGNPTWSFYYRGLIRAFRDSHRVIAPDHLGCGLSDKPQDFAYTLDSHITNVERLVDSLGLDKLTLVLHDWGGAIGMGFAARRPEMVKRFVVFNTAAFLATRVPLSIRICRIPGFGALAIRGFNAFARGALMRCVVHRERLTPAVVKGYLAPYDSWSNRIANLRFVQDIPLAASHPSYSVLQEIDTSIAQFADRPMLLLWGGQDFVFNDLFYRTWLERFPRAESAYFEDAGHYVLEDAQDRIVERMRGWLERTS